MKRKPVGIKKANSKILTSTPCRKLVKENHEKKTSKKLRKAEVAKKLEAYKKEVAKKQKEEKKARKCPVQKKKEVKKKKVTQRTGRRLPKKKIPDNPKL